MPTRVEKQTITGTDVIVGYGLTDAGDLQETVTDVEIDYTEYYERIATAAETIATNSTTIKDKMVIIQDDISRIRDLGDRNEDGGGFRTVQPFGEIAIAALWFLYIEKGKILDLDLGDGEINDLLTQNQDSNPALRQASIARVNQILDRLRNSGLNAGGF